MRGAVNNYNKLTGSTKVMLFGTNSVSGLEGKVTIKYDNASLYGLRVDDGTGEVFRVASNVSGKGYLSLFNGATEKIKLQASTATGASFFLDDVVIGATTSHASSKLEVSSTTQGFRIVPMTATQASAMTVAEGLFAFVSDTNGTFTSIGLWVYENGAWAKL